MIKNQRKKHAPLISHIEESHKKEGGSTKTQKTSREEYGKELFTSWLKEE
jgi:hypothetical protein